MMIQEAILKAIKSGSPVRVRYFSGSTPGSERDLHPLSLKDGKIRARCIPSGETKTFLLGKMELAIDGKPSELASTLPEPPAICSSVEEFATCHTNNLQQLGWVVQCDRETISLHRTFKNGKLIKKPEKWGQSRFLRQNQSKYNDPQSKIDSDPIFPPAPFPVTPFPPKS